MMIHAKSVTKIYGASEHSVTALKSVNLRVAAGERVAVVGKSGSGKSTLLNLLSGLDKPTSGSLAVGEQRLDRMTSSKMAEFRRRIVGVVFQAFQLLPNRSALQNVELPLVLSRISVAERRRRAKEALDRVGMCHRLHHMPFALSGGEQQRVAVARALIHRPQLLLADEPTGNLDSETAAQVQSLIAELCSSSGVTFILVTHDSQLAQQCCERQIRMADGELVGD